MMHLVSGLFFGGGQQVALDLTRTLPPVNGEQVRLCILGSVNPIMAGAADHVVEYDGAYNRPGSVLGAAMRLRRVMREVRPALIHAHGWDASMIAAVATTGTRSGCVVHWHTTDEWLSSPAKQHIGRRWLTRWFCGRANARVVAVSRASADHFCRWLPWRSDRVTVIHNGIDVERFRPAEPRQAGGPRPLVIGAASRLAAGKGVQYLLDAVAGIPAEERSVLQLRIAGEGGFRGELEARVRKLGLGGLVSFVGHVEAAGFYRELDLFVLPSLSEGLPLSVLEAMASGVPVIATNVGGLTEVISEGKNGILVPPRDPNALRHAIRQLAADAELRYRMARRAREDVSAHFSLSRAAHDVAELYRCMFASNLAQDHLAVRE